MQIEMMVQSERPNEYSGRRGQVKEIVLTMLDMSLPPTGRLTHPVEFYLEGDNRKEQFGNGKLIDKRVTVVIRKLHVWNGALRCEGEILSVAK